LAYALEAFINMIVEQFLKVKAEDCLEAYDIAA